MRLPWTAMVLLSVCAGCVALSPEERRQLAILKEHGYGVATPPPGFEAPVGEWTAAGLNALPGVGNFYLAYKGAGNWQWAVGTGNLLLWPISPLWAVAQGGLDARSMNERALLSYFREKARTGRKQHSRAENGGKEKDKASGEKVRPAGDRPSEGEKNGTGPRAAYEIVTEEDYAGGRAVFRVDVRDNAATAFQIVREVRPEIEKVLRDAFAAESPGVETDAIRVYVVPEFGADRSIRFRGWAFAIRPLAADGWEYDPETRHGEVRLRISGGMPAEEAKRWARENIEAIAREKNVALGTGGELPPGAIYQCLSESLENGVLTVEFEVVD